MRVIMIGTKIIFFNIFCWIVLFTGAKALYGAGGSGLAFLRIGVGGRAVGMGEAFTAAAYGAAAAYWNPAGLWNTEGKEVLLGHNEWLQGIHSEFVGITWRREKSAWGVSFASNVVDGLELRTKPTPKPQGTFDARDFMFGLSYARQCNDNIVIGVTAKFLYEKIYIEHSSGYALDAGILLIMPIEGLTVGFVAKNLGWMTSLRNESIDLPLSFRPGIAYLVPPSVFDRGSILLTSDMEVISGGNMHWLSGVELSLEQGIAFRFGYQTGYNARSITAGLGIRWETWQFDYGFTPFRSNLGNTHRLSISFSW